MKNNLVKIGKLILSNPIMPASGTFGYGIEFKDFLDLDKLGAIVTKSLSLDEQYGNPPPRINELNNGLLNSIGLANVGLSKFKTDILPKLSTLKTKIIVSFFGKEMNDYVKFARLAESLSRIDALEVNLSCPNVKYKTMELSENSKGIYKIVSSIRKVSSKPIIIKLSPNVSDIKILSKACIDAGCDGLTLINTLRGLVFTGQGQILKGGVSGPSIKPIALRLINEVKSTFDIPIIGCGGILNISDVLDFLRAGASAVQIGTANFKTPDIMIKLIEKLI